MDLFSVNGRSPVRVGLVQINNSFSGQSYLPYTIGLLQAYVEAYAVDPARYNFILPVYKRRHIDRNLESLKGVDVAGFSVYVWNIHISLATARRLKEQNPDCLIIFGGPHVPDRAEDFLRENPFIDVAAHGAGEQIFLQLLESYPGRDPGIKGVSYLDGEGRFIFTKPEARLKDLSSIPSPYLSGAFDALMEAMGDNEIWIAMWETNRGCPFSCTFCDWGSSVSGKVAVFDMERIKAEADWFSNKKIEFIFCCDANFGILKRDIDIVRYVADNKKRLGYPHALSVQNTKNATERAYLTQKVLNDAGLNKGVTVSFQSLDKKTLKAIKRDNIDLDSFEELQHRFMDDGVVTYTDLILGLPGETYKSYIKGIGHCIENGQHNRIQFNNLSILPNAEMGSPEYQKKYGMVVVESRSINVHGHRDDHEDGIYETQKLSVATASMPPAAWRRARAYSWMAAFLHFDKLLQVPLLVGHYCAGTPFTAMIAAFVHADRSRYPLIGEIAGFFKDEARKIQKGGLEYVFSGEWLGIYWPADEYAFIRISIEGKLGRFYEESEDILAGIIGDRAPRSLLREAVSYNSMLLKQPNLTEDITVELNYALPAFHAALGKAGHVDKSPGVYRIPRSKETWGSWEEWMRHVVWYGNKKGAYLYPCKPLDNKL
ncbi:MAG: hypothetical protein A3G18_05470 [Rhodospirillales bacterium RIFCSPLOWO2_12_FULL_58_28]|nr:MAG: hypothetical protein A3H92_05665 [Rhodospirillales bacterium RIFCSPLOWO2_02_FULL_58_16]OHC79403.1 MAG: hypothetical protein A3G18_05470 [Rhodospirillales bacterium RIFCSPLOWO2_12_FULL_58_28]